uniref:Uncharacterized protein n=1 Tax=Oncorhynchus tshawytscha TaxID=74940 RepID=A0A8C8MJX8_ONCTS
THHISSMGHEDGEVGFFQGEGGLTSRCSRVKMTGSDTNTRLDSLVMEAARMCELTVRSERLRPPPPRRVAFSVLRNRPRCL